MARFALRRMLMMLPMVSIIITGNIDLSVASTMAMCASFMGWLFMRGANIWAAVAAALLLGILAGLFNGYLVAKVKLPALVVTLGTFAFYRGMAYVLLGTVAGDMLRAAKCDVLIVPPVRHSADAPG